MYCSYVRSAAEMACLSWMTCSWLVFKWNTELAYWNELHGLTLGLCLSFLFFFFGCRSENKTKQNKTKQNKTVWEKVLIAFSNTYENTLPGKSMSECMKIYCELLCSTCIHCKLRARRVLMPVQDVQLRARRVLMPFKMFSWEPEGHSCCTKV